MKRFLCLILLLCFLCSSCAVLEERIQEPVTFYYVREDYQKNMEDVIVSEKREAAGHKDDLNYLLTLYLMGPSDEGNISPIPRGTSIFKAEQTVSGVVLELSDTGRTMTDNQFTLASACLSMTCMDLVGAEKVTIISGSRTVTLSRESLLFYDSITSSTLEEPQ